VASIERRAWNGRVTWQARWRDPAGQQRKQTFPRKIDAERFLTTIDHSMLTGGYVDPAAGRLTVGEWAERWLGGQVQLKPSTRVRYAGLLRVQVLPAWERVPLVAVTHTEVAAWVQRLVASGLAPSTVRQAHRVLSLLLDLAVRDGRLSRNPAARVPLPRARRPDKRFLTHQEVAALADAAGSYRLAILVLAYCGLRFGELAALRAAHLDLLRRRIFVVESVTEVSGRAVFGGTKTHQQRTVPLPVFLVDDLAKHVVGKGSDDYVFNAPKGGVLLLRNFRRKVFDPAAEAAGLSRLTPHDLRSTAASLAVSAGATVLSVQRLLGHSSAAMTLERYSGLFEDDLDAVADRLDAAARAPRVPPVCPEGIVVPITQRKGAR
jgi:integrase